MDERASFEAWYLTALARAGQMLPLAAPRYTWAKLDDSGNYEQGCVQGAWMAWQARAALSAPGSDGSKA